MASLAFGFAGAAIGSSFGYAALGFSIGSAIGDYLFQPDLPTIEGPRLHDLSVQSSAYNLPIPKLYGTMRIAGNIIWAQPILETRHETSYGGKGGGGGGTQITYTYSATLAVGICEGELIGIKRIWADSVLIADYSSDDAGVLYASLDDADNFTIYTGSETQTADPTIESYEGASNVPGFRGLSYVVIDNIQLEKFGNRIPNFTFEVIQSGSEDTAVRELHQDTTEEDGKFYDLVDGVFVKYDDVSGGYYGVSLTANPLGLIGNISSKNPVDVQYSQGELEGIGQYSSLKGYNFKQKVLNRNAWGDSPQWLFISSINSYGESYPDKPSNSLSLHEFTGSLYFRGLIVNASKTHILVLLHTTASDTASSYIILKYDEPNTLTQVSSGTIPAGDVNDTDSGYWYYDGDVVIMEDDLKHIWKYTNSSQKITLYEINDNDELGQVVTFAPSVGVGVAYWSSIYADKGICIFSESERTWIFTRFSKYTSSTASLGDVISDICAEVGLSAGDIDVTALSAVTVRGYGITRNMTARQALETLIKSYFLDVAESDNKLVFSIRGSASVKTLTSSDLIDV